MVSTKAKVGVAIVVVFIVLLLLWYFFVFKADTGTKSAVITKYTSNKTDSKTHTTNDDNDDNENNNNNDNNNDDNSDNNNYSCGPRICPSLEDGPVQGHVDAGNSYIGGNKVDSMEDCVNMAEQLKDFYNGPSQLEFRKTMAQRTGNPIFEKEFPVMYINFESSASQCKFYVACNGSNNCDKEDFLMQLIV